MNIIFAGTPEFAVPSLQILIENNLKPVAVISSEDMPVRRGKGFLPTPVKALALQHDIPVLQPNNLKSNAFYEQLLAFKPDILVVVAFKILPPRIFELPTLGAFNLHGSLLPKYRGAAPINRAIMAGEVETGVSTFFLQRKVDTGNLILQAEIPIHENETAGELHDKMMLLGAETVLETIRLIEKGNVAVSPQNDALACPAPKIFKEDCAINWQQSAQEVHNFIRGLSPFPSAWTSYNEMQFKVVASLLSDKILQSGQILAEGNRLFVGCANGAVEILGIQQEGRKRMDTADFLKGFRFQEEAFFALI